MRKFSRRDFKIYMRIRKSVEMDDLSDEELENMIQAEIPSIICADEMEPKRYESLLEAVEDIGVQKQT